MIKVQPPRVVVLGMVTKMPVGGVVWQTMHYLAGLRRLGFDAWYVESHARPPSMFVGGEDGDRAPEAAAYLQRILGRFGFGDRWAFHALHSDGSCYGTDWTTLQRLYASAELIINLYGGTAPLPEHVKTGRLLFLGTDPVQLEVELYQQNRATIEFLEAHTWHFTFGENYGQADCALPVTDRFELLPTRQPVVLDWWRDFEAPESSRFTTVGNWRQPYREIGYRNERYGWSKHEEFLKILDLPRRVPQELELALSRMEPADRELLEGHGWNVREALPFSLDPQAYREYVGTSRGEFTVAKDQNVRFRSGWFSDRSATYLASGRPVVTQDTGFGNVLPVGRGLFAFSDADEAAAAIEDINADYLLHRRAAAEVAWEYFGSEVVLGSLLSRAGIAMLGRPRSASTPATGALRHDLVLRPVRRNPTELHPTTLGAAEAATLPPVRDAALVRDGAEAPEVSVVMVTYGKLAFTKLCVESLLANTDRPAYELIVVDNASTDGTRAYLEALGRRFPHVTVIFSDRNLGFAAANNLGMARARGGVLVLLNNDTIVPPRWLAALVSHLERSGIGAAGPVSNRVCNEAQIEADYDTYGDFLAIARARLERLADRHFELPMLAMFCFAIKREVFERVGPLDERFGLGTFEDDDYSLRIRELGFRLACAEDVLVHHFGEASFGELVFSGEYQRLLDENRRRLEDKWAMPWEPHGRRESDAYRTTKERIRQIVAAQLPSSATVAVVSRGDDDLLSLDGRRGWHVPRTPGGEWAGWYPEGSHEAIETIENLRSEGADYLLIPDTSRWWLEFYQGLRQHLDSRYATVVQEPGVCTVFSLRVPEGS